VPRNFGQLFKEADWFSPELKRDWVRYRNDDNPSGVCWFVPSVDDEKSDKPVLSVIVTE